MWFVKSRFHNIDILLDLKECFSAYLPISIFIVVNNVDLLETTSMSEIPIHHSWFVFGEHSKPNLSNMSDSETPPKILHTGSTFGVEEQLTLFPPAIPTFGVKERRKMNGL